MQRWPRIGPTSESNLRHVNLENGATQMNKCEYSKLSKILSQFYWKTKGTMDATMTVD